MSILIGTACLLLFVLIIVLTYSGMRRCKFGWREYKARKSGNPYQPF